MKHILLLLPAIVLIGCQSEQSDSMDTPGLITDQENEYLISEVQADSLTITEIFNDPCSTALFSFHNSKGLQNAPVEPDSPFEPQWGYTMDLFKKIDSILMKRNTNLHTVDIQYQEENNEIYRLTINKRKCADSLKNE